jgi:hypothetical protein
MSIRSKRGQIIWDGIQSESETGDDFGVRSISLVD